MSGAAWDTTGRGPDLSEVRAALARLRGGRVPWRPAVGFSRWLRDWRRAGAARQYARAFVLPCWECGETCCRPGPGECGIGAGPAVALGCARSGASARALREALARALERSTSAFLSNRGPVAAWSRRFDRARLRTLAARMRARGPQEVGRKDERPLPPSIREAVGRRP